MNKKRVFAAFLISIAICAIGCDKQEDAPKAGADIINATNKIDALMDECGNSGAEHLIYEIWQLDAQFLYNNDFTQMERIIYDFGTPLWEGNNLAVLEFDKNTVNGSNLSETDYIQQRVFSAKYEYDDSNRTLTFDKGDKDGSFVARIVASNPNTIIIDGEDNTRTVYKCIDILDVACRAATLGVAWKYEQLKEFNKSDVTEQLIGKWYINTEVNYDNSWSNVTRVNELFGKLYCDGNAAIEYTFNADGTGEYSSEVPAFEPINISFTWSYDTDTSIVKIDGDFNETESSLIGKEFYIVGMSSNEIIRDIAHSSKNKRVIYKKAK